MKGPKIAQNECCISCYVETSTIKQVESTVYETRAYNFSAVNRIQHLMKLKGKDSCDILVFAISVK